MCPASLSTSAGRACSLLLMNSPGHVASQSPWLTLGITLPSKSSVLCLFLSPHPAPGKHSSLLLSPWLLRGWNHTVRAFSDRLLSLSRTHSRFLRVSRALTARSVLALTGLPLSGWTLVFSSITYGRMSWLLSSWALVNEASIHGGVQVFVGRVL